MASSSSQSADSKSLISRSETPEEFGGPDMSKTIDELGDVQVGNVSKDCPLQNTTSEAQAAVSTDRVKVIEDMMESLFQDCAAVVLEETPEETEAANDVPEETQERGDEEGGDVTASPTLAQEVDDVPQETRESGSNVSSGIDREQKSDEDDVNNNNNNNDFVLPNEELESKIIAQVESYFTDFNVMKDNFLLKHIRRNKEGYISLKLVSSFRKVKTLTKDWRVVRYCLRNSKKLQVNGEGTKVRRIVPIPAFEETSCAKMVLVFNIPTEEVTPEIVSKLMSKHGEVVDVTVVKPGSKIPDVCTKRCLYVNGDLVKKTFALVEYKTYESAQKAIAEEGQKDVTETGVKVAPLLSDVYKTNRGKSASEGKASQLKKMNSKRYNNNDDGHPINRRRRSAPNRFQYRQESSRQSDWRVLSSRPSAAKGTSNKAPGRLLKNGLSEKQPAKSSVANNGVSRHQGRERSSFAYLGGDPMNSWISNRYLPFKGGMAAAAAAAAVAQYNARLPDNVIRWPRGPDGTIGFHQPRGYRQHPHLGYGPVVQPGTNITDVIKGYIASCGTYA